MAVVAIFCSGSGSNFEAIAQKLQADGKHEIALMVCNQKEAFCFKRADNLGIKSYHINYRLRERKEVESELVALLQQSQVELIVLAGFMKLLTSVLIDAYANRIINIHPALLPKYPGTDGIGDSFHSGDKKLGISIHYVDYGMDTGKVICQDSFIKSDEDDLDSVSEKIHALEHFNYPEVVINLLNQIDNEV